MTYQLVKAAAFLCWAILLGVSVPTEMINEIPLNALAPRPEFQAVFTSGVIQFTSMCLLLPLAFMGRAPWGKPKQGYTVFAGLYGSACFFVPITMAAVGSELTVLVVLSAQLSMALFLDVIAGVVKLNDRQKFAGFALVLIGGFINAYDATSKHHSTRSPDTVDVQAQNNNSSFLEASRRLLQLEPTLDNSSLVLLAVAAMAGAGVAFESSCNCRLSVELGCWSRAAAWDSCISALATVPLGLLFHFKFGAAPVIRTVDWKRFLFSGACLASYQSSCAVLPRKIGTCLTFMAVKFGCLVAATIDDAFGLAGPQVPVSNLRLASLLLVCIGCAIFASSKGSSVKVEQAGKQALVAEVVEVTEMAESPRDTRNGPFQADCAQP